MTIAFGPLRLSIMVSYTPQPHAWEELIAIGMNDRELAQLNWWNTRVPETAIWEQRQLLLVESAR